MLKDDRHIIDYILDATDNEKQKAHFSHRNKVIRKQYKKIPLDQQLKYCAKCKCCWMILRKYMDKSSWVKYPKGHIPTIGKERELCKLCKGEKNEDS